MSTLKQRITDDMKNAMRNKDKQRLATIRLAIAAFKQIEVDERRELTDQDVLAILDKMVKQRRESIKQYQSGNREDLAAQEQAEIVILQNYLPQPLSTEEIAGLIDAAMQTTGASSMQDMGKVMGQLKSKLQGRADMGAVSQLIKQKLAG